MEKEKLLQMGGRKFFLGEKGKKEDIWRGIEYFFGE